VDWTAAKLGAAASGYTLQARGRYTSPQEFHRYVDGILHSVVDRNMGRAPFFRYTGSLVLFNGIRVSDHSLCSLFVQDRRLQLCSPLILY